MFVHALHVQFTCDNRVAQLQEHADLMAVLV